MIFGLFRGNANRRAIDRLYGEIVAMSRTPVLFTDFGIADDIDGRFESLALHATLVLRRLKRLPPPGAEIAQELMDTLFRHFDLALREMGVGDMSVPKRMKTMAEAFLGRANAYDEALGEGHLALSAALARNICGGSAQEANRLARYVEGLEQRLAHTTLAQFLDGSIFSERSGATDRGGASDGQRQNDPSGVSR